MAKEAKVVSVRGQRVTRVDDTEWTWLIDGIQFWWRELDGLNTLRKVPAGPITPIVHSDTLNHAVLCSAAWMNGWYAREELARRQQQQADARGG